MQRTDVGRRAWTARRAARRLRWRVRLLAIAVGLGAVLVAAAVVGRAALGRLGEPFVLLVALPPLAQGLAAFGLRDLLAARIAAIHTGERRLLASYGLWLATSALLTLDVAAVAAGSVAMAIGRDRGERRWQLGAAVLGSNLGSLLFPFSNLTNLVLVTGSGIGLVAYLGASVPAQIAAAAAGGALLVARFMADQDADHDDSPAVEDRPLRYAPERVDGTSEPDRAPVIAGSFAAAVAVVAVASGLTGGSMAWPFLAGSAIVVAAAVTTRRLEPEAVVRSVPRTALAVVVVAALAAGPIAGLAGLLPSIRGGDPITLVLVAAVGAILAALLNNLPAAAFGAAWLGVASPEVVVAYLIGTNVAALVTPHGSVATMLARSVARDHGHDDGVRSYLETAWRYAGVTSLAAVLALVVLR